MYFRAIGVIQQDPVVKPETIEKDDVRNMSADAGNGNTESNFSLLGAYQWYIKHTTLNFKADIGFDFLRFKGYHYGVPEFETSFLDGQGAVTPGSFVLYPTGGANNLSYNTHEPGHVLQYRILGKLYYPLIALPSLWNANDSDSGDGYTEKTANQLWYWYTGEKDPRNKRYFD